MERQIEMVWECPACGLQMAQLTGVSLRPPTCAYGHSGLEMEQRLASRWGAVDRGEDRRGQC